MKISEENMLMKIYIHIRDEKKNKKNFSYFFLFFLYFVKDQPGQYCQSHYHQWGQWHPIHQMHRNLLRQYVPEQKYLSSILKVPANPPLCVLWRPSITGFKIVPGASRGWVLKKSWVWAIFYKYKNNNNLII